jgi:anti-sigma factor RsiW
MLFLDSEGDPQLHLCVREHLASCPDCAAWFAREQHLDQKLCQAIASGQPTTQLWQRVLAGMESPLTPARRRKRLALITALTAAAALVALVFGLQFLARSIPSELSRNAAEWHEQWQRGNVHPDLVSTSDQEVDRYLKTRVPFRVHCPPRTDVQFSVQGAGVCFMQDQRQAAYIVGSVGESPVSILVMDGSTLDGFPQEFQQRREGAYRIASAVIAENVVFVIGAASPEVLERLLHAYGSYHEG